MADFKSVRDLQAAGTLTDADRRAFRALRKKKVSGNMTPEEEEQLKFILARLAQAGGTITDADLKAAGKK